MKTLSQIQEELKAALTSQSWNRLKNSLLGKELLAFGSRVIYNNEVFIEQANNALDYTKATARELVSLAQMQNVPVSFVKPSFVEVGVTGSVLYKPFEIVYNVGGVSFYNIEYVQAPGTVVLYAGALKVVASTTDNLSGLSNLPQSNSIATSSIVKDTESIKVIPLGKAYPESVYVYCEYEGKQLLLSRYDPMRIGSEVYNYKLITLYDGTQAVCLGDGVWGKNMPDAKLQILWLEPSVEVPSTDGTLLVPGKVISLMEGNSNSLDYAREVFRKEYLKTRVVASEKQLKEFVNSYEPVMDCAVSALNNLISVYIKPAVEGDSSSFDYIAADLDVYGMLTTSHEVDLGSPLLFDIYVSGVDSAYESQITKLLQDELAYENLPYDFKVSVGTLASKVQSTLGITPLLKVKMSSSSPTSPMTLQMPPDRGSVKLLDTNGRVVAFDSNSVIYGPSGNTVKATIDFGGGESMAVVNDFVVAKKSGTTSIIQYQGPSSIEIKNDASLVASTVCSNGFVVRVINGSAKIYASSQFNSDSLIAGITPLAVMNTTNVRGIYHNNIWLTAESNVETNITALKYYTISSSGEMNNYFTLNIAAYVESPRLLVSGNKLFVISTNPKGTNYDTVVVVNHFMSSNYSYYIAQLASPISEFSSPSESIIGVVSKEEGSLVIRRYSGVQVTSAGLVEFTNQVACEGDDVWGSLNISSQSAYDIKSFSVAADSVLLISQGVDDMGGVYKKVGFNPIVQEIEDMSSGIDIDCYEMSNIGSINYFNGYLEYRLISGIVISSLEFTSSHSPAVSKSEYLKLRNIVWE